MSNTGYVGGSDGAPAGGGGAAATPESVFSFRRFGARYGSPDSNTVMADSGIMEQSDYVHSSALTKSAAPGGLYLEQTGNVTIHTGVDNGSLAETGHSFPEDLPVYRAIFEVESTGGSPGVRLLGGLGDASVGTVATATASNDPSGQYVAIQFAKDRDTNFQIAHRDTAQVLVDTGIAFAFDKMYAIEVAYTSSTAATVKLWDGPGVSPVAFDITTQLPPAGTLLGDVISIVNDIEPFVGVTIRQYCQSIWTASLFPES